MREYAIKEIIGKTISSIIVRYGRRGPCSQLLLFFTDGTGYEWFSWDGEIAGTKSLDHRRHEELLPDDDIVYDSKGDEDLYSKPG